MNFTGVNLDLQGLAKRTYANITYKSTFMNFLNRTYQEIARTGTPIIEVVKQLATNVNVRNDVEIAQGGLTNELATYNSVKVDLTELPLDYSFRISPLMIGSSVKGTIEGQIELKDSEVSKKIDKYGYDKLNTKIVGSEDGSMAYVNGQVKVWAPSTKEQYIELLNTLSSILYDRDIVDGYLLGLSANEYADYVSALTSVLKFETRAGVEGVDQGKVGQAYGVEVFQINSNMLKNNNVVGFFANEIATVGDMFFSAMAQYPGNFPGYPGYFALEGNIMFGAEVVRSEAMIKLVKSVPSITAGTFTAGTVSTSYNNTTFTGTNASKWVAIGLPAGLSMNESTGAITGTPTTAGTSDVTVYAIDSYGNYSNAKTGKITIASA